MITQERLREILEYNPFTGVYFHKATGKYLARIHVGSKCKCLGYFDDASKAGEAYAKAAPEYHGEFARTE